MRARPSVWPPQGEAVDLIEPTEPLPYRSMPPCRGAEMTGFPGGGQPPARPHRSGVLARSRSDPPLSTTVRHTLVRSTLG